ncbi:MAG TPA: RNA polymerase factor sigma-32 [Polyangiaceae bacterium]|nr:RNA polymerase factor sigma-32 [Polyangiaceae bacterium]
MATRKKVPSPGSPPADPAKPVAAKPAAAGARAKPSPRSRGARASADLADPRLRNAVGAEGEPDDDEASARARDEDDEDGGGDGGDDEREGRDDDIDAVVDVPAEVVEEIDAPADLDDGDARTTARPGRPGDEDVAISRHDPLQAYLREVQRHPLLTPDEEHDLAKRYAAGGDVNAAARLVTSNLRLVVKIAYEYRRAYKNIMDLIQEGNIGLMQAVKKFDPHRGVKLSSYSAWWIRAYILRFIINNWRLVKLGTTQAQRKLFFNLNKEKARLSAMGIEPTSLEIAARLGVDEQEAIDMDRRLSSGEMSLDAPVGDAEGRPVSRLELMPATTAGPEVMVADEQVQTMLREKLAEFRQTLKGKDIEIFDRRLVADEPLTLQELGDHFGISRERVRQIEARLTMNLRQFLRNALGDAVETVA